MIHPSHRDRQKLIMAIAWAPYITNKDFPEDYFDWTLEDKIRLFEEQILGWQLNIADEIINDPENRHPHSGFAVLSILLNYFEMIGGYLDGVEGETTKRHFKQGITNVFPDLGKRSDIIDILYKEARCGMYHVGITGKSIVISRNHPSVVTIVEYSTDRFIVIDPHRLTDTLIVHFKNYVENIRGVSSIVEKENFEKRFNFLKREKVIIQSKII